MPTVAFLHDHSWPSGTRQLDIDGKKMPYDNQIARAGIATSNGLSATTMPIERDGRGLPIGVQIIGGFLDDRTSIAFAGIVEREFGGFTPLRTFRHGPLLTPLAESTAPCGLVRGRARRPLASRGGGEHIAEYSAVSFRSLAKTSRRHRGGPVECPYKVGQVGEPDIQCHLGDRPRVLG